MTSSSFFRARRSVDPKPIHYGPFHRESRSTSSLNDLSAAWENVDEARTALEAVEARIHEANLGVSHRTNDDDNFEEPPIREVFSQNQRLGRVSRYELRPTINERQYSRDMDHSSRHHLFDIPSSIERTRASHTPSIQNYNGSKYYDRHSPPSRDLRTISPPYINDTDAIESSLLDDNLSLKRDADYKWTKEDTANSATHLGTSNFEDSLEVSATKRKQVNGVRPLSPKVAIADHSEALARLKERIKKQKARTPAPKQKENEDVVVNVIQPISEDRQTHDETYIKPVCKRKVVTAAPPTGYKGFSIPESTTVPSKDKQGRTQYRNASLPYSSKAGHKRTNKPQKPSQTTDAKIPKGGAKMRRITASRPPMDFITPFSWRTGIETVKKVLGPSNTRPKSTASTRAQSSASQNTTNTSSRIENGERYEKEDEEKVVPEEKVTQEDKADDTALSEDVLSEGLLSEDAKNILSDLEMDSDNSGNDDEPIKGGKSKLDTNNFPKRKSSSPDKEVQRAKKVKPKTKKRMFPNHKSPDTSPPKSIVQRHYDVDKVKKYMDKKIQDRKDNMKKEKQLKQEAVDGRKKKLQELYNKQRKILNTNLSQNTSSRHKMGETHSVIPGNFNFQHHPYNLHPEFLYQDTSESDKESTDVASYAGLPGPSERRQQKPTNHDFNRHSVASSDVSSEMSVESLDKDHAMSADGQEDKEDDRADVTMTPEENSFTRSSRVNRETPREEREGRDIYPGFPTHDYSVSAEASSSVTHPSQPHSVVDELIPGPSRTDRIEAIRNKAALLKQRLEREAKRLGLSLLDNQKLEKPPPSVGMTAWEPDVFRGNLPGVSNLHEQAELNEQLESMNSAATRIQAVYRGYSTRQGLNWKLPSGRTLGGIIRNAPRQTAIEGRAESMPLYLASDASSESNLSDVETAYSHISDRSLHSRNRKPTSALESRSYSTATQSTASKGYSSPLSRGHYRPSTTLGKSFTEGKGDRMSVINIYLRNLRQSEEERPRDTVNMDEELETASLYSDSQIDKFSDTASLINDIEDLKEDVDLDKTLVKESPTKTSHEYETMEQELDDDGKTPSVNHSYSHSFSSHGSPSRSSLTHSQTDTEYSPIRHSVKSTTPPRAVDDSTHPGHPTTRYPPSMYFPNHQGGDRMSPGSLDHRMIAELNRLEFMEESVRQLTDIERTNSVSLAQQETVSLAQILKAKQASYAKDMEALQLKAKQEKLDSARQLDEARHAAVQSSINAQETVAKVKSDAASSIAQSTDRLVKAQTEASRMTTESAKRVEEARTEAARTLLDAANKQITAVGTVASSAASAAAQEAVRNTLEQFRQEQRPSRKHDSSRSSPESRSYSSYSRGSYTEEWSPSYSRSRSSRIATERESGASKGDGYTSDEFESFKESEVARSVRTASPDRTYHSDKVDNSFVRDRDRSETKSSDNIPEEVDLSVSEGSVVSDVVISDKSVKEAADSSDHKPKDKTDHDYSMTFEDSVMSSRTVTDDEMDYRLILPSEGHRRRSIGKSQRSGSICSDAGTVSYSSDDNADKHLSESIHEKNTPFSGEDSFSKFTTDMVKLMREEEVRAKHLEALLHLREKALKENSKAEMEWLELQKKQMRDKRADDVMPYIKKRQRDVIKRLKAEKAEIKYLMAANRAARYDRKLLMMNQEEITRLRRSTQKIRGKVREEEAVTSRDQDKITNEVPESVSEHTRRSTPLLDERLQDESPSKSTTIPEEFSAIESPTADSSFPTYDHESTITERVRKRSLSEGESDDGAPSGSIASRSKGSPTSSDSIVMQQLKKLKSHSSERYLTQREQKLMRRKHEGEDTLSSDRRLIEWERHLDEEEDKLNDVNRIKSQKSKRAITDTQSKAKEEDLANMPPDRSRESSIPEIDSISKDISEASDHSDVETRIRELRQQLQQREREVRRLHKEKKRQKRAMLHEEEENLRKKLQAVERILQQTKDNFERPAAEIKPAETALNTSDTIHPSESKESIPERSSSSESARDEPRSTVREKSIPEKSRSEDEAQDVRVPESRESIPGRSSSGEGFLKGLNVVLDLDFGSQDREAVVADNESVNKFVSEVKDLDISDRSGLFSSSEKHMNHTNSYTDEIEDNAMTAEDISEASEIQTISGASEAEVPSRSLSVRSDQQRSRAESDESLPEIISTRSSRRPDYENSVPEELSVKSYRRSVDESISEALSKRSSQRSGSESISEALSLKSSQKSATVSIPEALSARSSRRSEDESLPEAISARSSKATVFSSHHSKPPTKDYSNTFESDRTHDEGETDDDISEQIIEEEENISPDKETTQKSYSSDFEVSESPKSKIGDSLDIKERSLQNASLYSQDFESPSSSHRADQLSLEKSIPRSYRDDLDELTQRRLSQASNEESIVEEVPEEDYRSIESGSLSDASNEMTPRVSLRKEDMNSQKLSEHEEDQMVAREKDTSQYSQDFESPSSHRDSKHSSEKESCSKHLSRNEDLERKLNEEPKPRVSEATDEESVAEEIPEDRASVESGALSDASDEMTPRFSLSNRKDSDNVGQDTVHQQSKYEDGEVLDEEKETSKYSQEFESPSPHRMSEQSLDKENRSNSLSRKDEPDRELDVSSQRRLSEATDEGSVVEDLPEETLETDALSDADELSPRFESKEEKAGKMDSVVLPSKDEDEKPLFEGKDNEVEDTVKKPVEEPKEFRSKLVDKISHDLSNNLMDEAVTCITSLYDEHRLRTTPHQLPVGLKTSTACEEPDKSDAVEFKADSEKENSDSFNEWGKAPEEGFEISEGEDLSISEKISFAEDDESSPILDLTPLVSEPEKDKADQSLAPRTEEIESTKPTDDKKGQSDAVIDQLSENLLKEAASEMIALMRKKQAKEEKVEKKEPPKSPSLHSPEHSPQQRGFDKFMAVHRFPDEVLKQVSPPGSPTKDHSVFDGNELANKLSQLKLLHEELGAQLGEDDDDDDDFVINENKPLELPTDNEEYGPPSGQSIPIVVPHISSEVVSIVTTSLSSFYRHKKAGGSLGSLSPPPEFSESNIDNDDPDSQMKQSYRRMIFDLTGEVFRDVLNEETPPTRPPWMKPRRCRRNRFYHTLLPTMDEHDYLHVVQQHVLDLVGLGNERPNLETLRRKTPLKVGKKDFVDAVLIQELREEEPQWVDYDDDELAVKFQVADAIFESLMSETIMVLNAVHRRKESKVDRSR